MSDLETRAARHAALADVTRLAVVDLLAVRDASPREIGETLGLGSNLLAHHLAVLERTGLVERRRSEADRRRSYVRLVDAALPAESVDARPWADAGELLFVCTGNSARSQLAAAIWNSHRGAGVPAARSAGTHPADRVDPGAVDVAVRRGLRLAERPVALDPADLDRALVVTVCDAAHEELAAGAATGSLHWSLPDPVALGGTAFEAAADELERRIHRLRPVKDHA